MDFQLDTKFPIQILRFNYKSPGITQRSVSYHHDQKIQKKKQKKKTHTHTQNKQNKTF